MSYSSLNKSSADVGNISEGGNPYGIEREIVIMKLISHSNVMGLYEVWENKSELYLVLEYVDGGELFDYLVSRGKLNEIEAVRYFKQIIQGVSYCHSFNICHRDLKPENLLLDKKKKSIKIADFGMAALQVSNTLLKTSCGSPHYASPEIVMGKSYNGAPSDIWSCGIILFALLTGHLPFNDDNIKKLLIKVQTGKFMIPKYLSPKAKDLISRILIVDPARRLNTEQILKHPLITKYDNEFSLKQEKKLSKQAMNKYNKLARGKSNTDLDVLNNIPENTEIIEIKSRNDIDGAILKNLMILWHGTSRDIIIAKLLQTPMSEEKLIYSLLWQYKQRSIKNTENPSNNTNNSPETSSSSVITSLDSTNTNANYGFNKRMDNDTNTAPKLLQKSKFSVNSLKKSESENETIENNKCLPSALPPVNMSIFPVSSSKSFRKSGSLLSIHSKTAIQTSSSVKSLNPSTPKKYLPVSSSKRSIIASPSMKSIHTTLQKRRTLQNSESKRSLYSLQSISKRSLNLNDFLKDGSSSQKNPILNDGNLPPLPSLYSNTDFETICNQLLFGNDLDEISEEQEDIQLLSEANITNNNNLNISVDEDDIRDIDIDVSNDTITKDNLTSLETTTEMNTHMKHAFIIKNDSPVQKNESDDERPIANEQVNFPFQGLTEYYQQKQKEQEQQNDHKDKISVWGSNSPEIKNKVTPVVLKKKTNYYLRTASEQHAKPELSKHSLDPRRNISVPATTKIESILSGLKKESTLQQNFKRNFMIRSKSNLKNYHASNDWHYSKDSLFNPKMVHSIPEQIQACNSKNIAYGSDGISSSNLQFTADLEPKQNNMNEFTADSGTEDVSDPSVLAQSSAIQRQSPLLEMPESFKNTSMTFKNLSDFLASDEPVEFLTMSRSDTNSLENSTPLKKERSVYKRLSIPRAQSKTAYDFQTDKLDDESSKSFSSKDRDISDMTFAMEMTTSVFTAQAIKVAAGKSENITRQLLSYSNTDDNINKFEDIPSDSKTIDTSTTSSTISFSEVESEPKVHKKAVSINSLNTSNVITPATDVRVSLYVNNNVTTNFLLPRETTEEILSKFNLSPEKQISNQFVQKRFSLIQPNKNENVLNESHSVLSMFKDLEEDQMDKISKATSIQVHVQNQVSIDNGAEYRPNRVTMLFDDDFVGPVNSFTDNMSKNIRIVQSNPDKEQTIIKQKTETQQPGEEFKEHSTDQYNNPKKAKQASKFKHIDAKEQESKTVKSNWFNKLFRGLKSTPKTVNNKSYQDHITTISFELTHIVALKEFEKHGIEYKLKFFDKTSTGEKVQYDCKFVKGNFRFKIKIERLSRGSNTIVTLRKKKILAAINEAAFNKFNEDVEEMIRNTERKINGSN